MPLLRGLTLVPLWTTSFVNRSKRLTSLCFSFPICRMGITHFPFPVTLRGHTEISAEDPERCQQPRNAMLWHETLWWTFHADVEWHSHVQPHIQIAFRRLLSNLLSLAPPTSSSRVRRPKNHSSDPATWHRATNSPDEISNFFLTMNRNCHA